DICLVACTMLLDSTRLVLPCVLRYLDNSGARCCNALTRGCRAPNTGNLSFFHAYRFWNFLTVPDISASKSVQLRQFAKRRRWFMGRGRIIDKLLCSKAPTWRYLRR